MTMVTPLSARALTSADADEREAFVSAFSADLLLRGVVLLADTDVDAPTVDAAFDAMAAVFALPRDVKDRYRAPDGAGQRGFTGFGPAQAILGSPPDPKEYWHVGRSGPKERAYGENVWPAEVPAFKSRMQTLFDRCDRAASTFVTPLDSMLAMQDGDFAALIRDGNAVVRALHYPRAGVAGAIGQHRAAPHTDIDLFTVWVGATQDGLEFEDGDGWWSPSLAPGTVIAAAGEMLQFLSRGAIPAARHRVVSGGNDDASRYSMVYLVHPEPDARLIPLGAHKDGERYPTADEYLHERILHWSQTESASNA